MNRKELYQKLEQFGIVRLIEQGITSHRIMQNDNPLNYWLLKKDQGKALVDLSHKYETDFSIPDPESVSGILWNMEVEINLKSKVAQATFYQDSLIWERLESVLEEPKKAKQLNALLAHWLENLTNQNYQIAV